MSLRGVVVEADGGSRGNPGPAAYGAVLKDAGTGAVLAERGEAIGVASNNVAEYRGLIGGLELAAAHAPGAAVEVRMDSRLVVEQMSGRWRIKHPSMLPLAARARDLAPGGTTYTWVPRAENAHADRLANLALDGQETTTEAAVLAGDAQSEAEPDPPPGQAGDQAGVQADGEAPRRVTEQAPPDHPPARGWAPRGRPTTLVLVRHGVTDHTVSKLFSGGLGSSNPPLNEEGRLQARATGEWLAPLAGTFDALVSSPVRRTHETAEIIGEFIEREIEFEHGIAEMEFGSWDGLSFTEVHERYPDEMSAWLGDLESAPHGGESFRAVEKRVLEGRDRIVTAYGGRTVVAVSHVTPIKTLVADALGAPLDAVYRMELAPASVTVISYFLGGPSADIPMSNLRLYNGRPTHVFE